MPISAVVGEMQGEVSPDSPSDCRKRDGDDVVVPGDSPFKKMIRKVGAEPDLGAGCRAMEAELDSVDANDRVEDGDGTGTRSAPEGGEGEEPEGGEALGPDRRGQAKPEDLDKLIGDGVAEEDAEKKHGAEEAGPNVEAVIVA